jgi:hypothetical protein
MALEVKNAVQELELFTAAYDYVNPAPSDITVTLEKNTALVTSYDPDVEILSPDIYTIPSNTMVIPQGQRVTPEKFKFNINTSTLSSDKKYGIGFTITQVSKSGVTIPANMKDVVYVFSIKNKYDGVYKLKGYHNRSPYTFPYDETIHMVTEAPNSVIFYWPEVKSNGHPIGVGPGTSNWYGAAISPVVVFDLATDKVTDVHNNPPQTTVITMFTGPGSGESRFEVDPNDPDKRTMYVYWNYGGNPQRAFFDTLTYIGPRPQ